MFSVTLLGPHSWFYIEFDFSEAEKEGRFTQPASPSHTGREGSEPRGRECTAGPGACRDSVPVGRGTVGVKVHVACTVLVW